MKKILLILIVCLVDFSTAMAQCSACRATVESQIQTGEMTANGINSGILYLMIIPYLLILTIGIVLYRNYQKKSSATL